MNESNPPDTIAVTTKASPGQLRLIQTLLRAGWTHRDIQTELDISRRTLFRRLAEIRRIERRKSYPNP